MNLGSGTFADFDSPNIANFTALASFTSEASLLAGTNTLPFFPPGFFNRRGKGLTLRASGVLGSNATPSYTFTWRFHTAQVTATSSVSGTIMGITAAMVTASGAVNQQWEAELNLKTTIPGIGTNAMTLMCWGWFKSGGLALPYLYPFQPSAPPTATWTQTLDGSLTYHPNLTCTSTASDAANAVTCKNFDVFSWN